MGRHTTPARQLQWLRFGPHKKRAGPMPAAAPWEKSAQVFGQHVCVGGALRGRAHLWAASTGLPGLRCASMPLADEVMFSFGPGVAAGGLRALEALWVVAAVDMGGLDNNARTGTSSVDQARAGKGVRFVRGRQRGTLTTRRRGTDSKRNVRSRGQAAEGQKG